MNNPLNQTATVQPQPVLPISGYYNCGCTESGSGGAETFLELTDTPDTYIGQEGKVVTVKEDGSGLEFTAAAGGSWRPAARISRSDLRWTDDHTFSEPAWVGTNPIVYYNGSKFLTPEVEGYSVLVGGGFTYDPAKFQFYDGEFLYAIF